MPDSAQRPRWALVVPPLLQRLPFRGGGGGVTEHTSDKCLLGGGLEEERWVCTREQEGPFCGA